MLALSFNSCVKDDFDQPPVLDIAVGEVKSVVDIQALAAAHSDSDPLKITEDMSMFGLITMGEKSGNLYKQAIIEDETGGILIEFLGSTSLSVGDSIMVNLNGARVFNYNGLHQVDSLDITKNVLKLSAGNTVTLPELTLAEIKTGGYTGRVAKIMDVQFVDSDLGKIFAVETVNTNRNIEDCDGNSVIVRTSGYANFADKIVPEGKGSMVAFVSIFSTPQLLIRTYDEIEMNGERCDGGGGGGGPVDPVDVVDEDFQSLEEYDEITLEGWTDLIVAGDRNWIAQDFDGGIYAQASGYNSGLSEMETWMITPPVTNISEKVLSFKSAKAYWAHSENTPLTVLISTDFVGDNFETATWTELSVNIATESSADHAWVESGEVDLSDFSGNGAIAFKYVGSDSESTSFRIDDVLIDVPGGGGGGGGTVDPVAEINEDFESLEEYDEITMEGWTDLIVTGNRNWIAQDYNGIYAQASGYNSGLDEMETWMITPPVTNIEDKTLSFKSAIAYWAHGSGHPGTVLISTDFVGDNFETATWTELNVTLAQESDGDHTWVESGEYDLSAFSGNAAIAFRYIGSATESTSFRIDDIVVTDGTGGGGGGSNATYSETFDSSLGSFSGINVSGDQVWEHATYDDGCAKMSGYDGSSFANEDWLISPAYDLTDNTNTVLNVKQAAGYINDDWSQIAILISTDYNGTDPNAASWTEVTAPNMPSGNDFTFVESGDIDLSNWDGETIYVAFKYISSDDSSSTWEISSVEIK